MKKYLFILVIAAVIVSALQINVLFAQPDIKDRMQGAYRAIADLLTDVSSIQRFNDPKNEDRIQNEIKELIKFSHNLKRSTADADTDPSIKFISRTLQDELNEAYQSFKQKDVNKEYVRGVLKNIPSYCIECHTQNTNGAEFQKLPFEPSGAQRPLDLAEFYAATRQFDRSIEAVLKVLKAKPDPGVDVYELDNAIRKAVTTAVRYKKNPKIAEQIVQAAIHYRPFPEILRMDLEDWLKTIRSWDSERPRKLESDLELRNEARRLMNQAKAQQAYSFDHSADIYYMRASAVLHQLLKQSPNGRYMPEALLLLGTSYEVLSPRRLESIHYAYYEACIRNSPHTEIARTCYRRYESGTLFGFSGSSGTHLPNDVRNKLLELWAIAMEIKGNL